MIISTESLGLTILDPRILFITIGGSATQFSNSPQTIISCVLASDTGIVTITTGAAHKLATGQFVEISGTDDPSYVGEFSVTVTGSATFTYQLPATVMNSLKYAGITSPDNLSGTPQVIWRIMAQRMWILAPSHAIAVGPGSTQAIIPIASGVWYFENPNGSKFYLDKWYVTGTNADVVKILYV